MEITNQEKTPLLLEENIHLKSKIAFSIGALEGIKFLLKNNDPALAQQNLDHLRKVVERVIDNLKEDS